MCDVVNKRKRNDAGKIGFSEIKVKPHSPPRTVTMQLRNGIQTLDAYRPTFDPHLDIATVVFSHVQCVKTRDNLALVSKLWRDASKPAAAYPLRFDFDAFTGRYRFAAVLVSQPCWTTTKLCLCPTRESLDFLVKLRNYVCHYAATPGSVRLLKWARENNLAWSANTCASAAHNGHLPALQYLHENGCPWDVATCHYAAHNGHLPALQYLHENGCPWDPRTCLYAAHDGRLPALKYLHENGCPWNSETCAYAADNKHWDCLQYAVDNKCDEWENYAEKYAKHLR